MNDTKKSAIAANIVFAEAVTPISIPMGTLVLTFSNGRELRIDAETLTPQIIGTAIMHGLKQKLVDAAAISRDPETGRTATIDTKYNAVKEVFERLTIMGEWNKTREGGAGGTGGLLYRALVRMYEGKKSPEELKEYLAGKSAAEQAALRKNPRVAAIIDDIRAEGGEDTSEELLAELEG
jgi:hypothetical protein